MVYRTPEIKNSSRNMANHSEPISGPAPPHGVRLLELFEDTRRTFAEVRSKKTLRDECGEPAGLGGVELSEDDAENRNTHNGKKSGEEEEMVGDDWSDAEALVGTTGGHCEGREEHLTRSKKAMRRITPALHFHTLTWFNTPSAQHAVTCIAVSMSTALTEHLGAPKNH